ncbi:MAG: RDD family protein [bacterium]
MENPNILVNHNKYCYTSFWKRSISLTIDFLILDLVGFLWMFFFSLGMFVFFRIILKVDDIRKINLLWEIISQVWVIISFILLSSYFIFMHGRYGATLGKMIVKIKVVKQDYTPINYKIAMIRYFAFLLSCATCGIGFLLAAFDSKKQSLHDKIAKTYVVYR